MGKARGKATRKKTATGETRTNVWLLKEAMDLLYRTHLKGTSQASHRGHAIRAIDRILVLLGEESYAADLDAET